MCYSEYGSPSNSAWTDTSTTQNLNTSQCAVLQSDYKVSVTLPLGGTSKQTNKMANTAQKIGCRRNPMTLDGVEPPEWNLAPTTIIDSGSFSIWNNGDYYSANLNTLDIVESGGSELVANRIVSVGGRYFSVDYYIDCGAPDGAHRGIQMVSADAM